MDALAQVAQLALKDASVELSAHQGSSQDAGNSDASACEDSEDSEDSEVSDGSDTDDHETDTAMSDGETEGAADSDMEDGGHSSSDVPPAQEEPHTPPHLIFPLRLLSGHTLRKKMSSIDALDTRSDSGDELHSPARG